MPNYRTLAAWYQGQLGLEKVNLKFQDRILGFFFPMQSIQCFDILVRSEMVIVIKQIDVWQLWYT